MDRRDLEQLAADNPANLQAVVDVMHQLKLLADAGVVSQGEYSLTPPLARLTGSDHQSLTASVTAGRRKLGLTPR